MNMQLEAFYAAAKDADFKAVKEGHVWCTKKNMFQETMGLGDVILDIHEILTEEDPDPERMLYLYPLH